MRTTLMLGTLALLLLVPPALAGGSLVVPSVSGSGSIPWLLAPACVPEAVATGCIDRVGVGAGNVWLACVFLDDGSVEYGTQCGPVAT